MADLALEAAAQAAVDSTDIVPLGEEPFTGWSVVLSERVVKAYLDSLLGGLPEEAVEAASEVVGNRGDGVFGATVAKPMMEAFLRSLRSGLERDGDK